MVSFAIISNSERKMTISQKTRGRKMLKISEKIVKFRNLILILAFLLLIPSGIGYLNTKVNYDILYYLPDEIETMQGQNILVDEFGTGAYSMFICEGMSNKDVAKLKKQIEQGEAPANYANTMRHIATIPLKPLTETKLISIDNGNVIFENEGHQQTLSGFDHIVFAVGSRPENKLYEQVKDCGKEVYIFGDAKQVGTALDATRDGTAIVLSL